MTAKRPTVDAVGLDLCYGVDMLRYIVPNPPARSYERANSGSKLREWGWRTARRESITVVAPDLSRALFRWIRGRWREQGGRRSYASMDSLKRDTFRAWTKHHRQHNLMQLRRDVLSSMRNE